MQPWLLCLLFVDLSPQPTADVIGVFPLREKKTDLEVKVQAFLHPESLWENVLLFHVVGQGVVAVSCLALREEDGVVEAQELAASHSLFVITKLSIGLVSHIILPVCSLIGSQTFPSYFSRGLAH